MFYVFHDYATSRARIHDEQCQYCNGGRGMKDDLPQNPALWSGPFDTIGQAEKVMDNFAAHKTGPDIGYCPLCF